MEVGAWTVGRKNHPNIPYQYVIEGEKKCPNVSYQHIAEENKGRFYGGPVVLSKTSYTKVDRCNLTCSQGQETPFEGCLAFPDSLFPRTHGVIKHIV